MEDKIREYVYGEYSIYPQSKRIVELRENLCTEMIEKYYECRRRGLEERESYIIATSL